MDEHETRGCSYCEAFARTLFEHRLAAPQEDMMCSECGRSERAVFLTYAGTDADTWEAIR